MGNKEAEYWKLFYDAIRALFVLDDMLDKQLNNFVQTDAYKRGLSLENVEQAIKILNKVC